MNKAELVQEIARKSKVTKKQADDLLTSTIHVIMSAVARRDKVSLLGFGTFECRSRKEREGRNPQTGETLTIPAKTVPVFSPGKEFKEKVSKRSH